MPWGVAAAVVGGAISASSASKASKAAKKGAKQQAKESEKAKKEGMAEADSAYKESSAIIQPWMDAGKEALGKLQKGVFSGEFDPGKFHFDYDSFEKDPGYKFRVDEGQRAMEQGAAASGKLLSGQQQKALLGYGQKMGSQEYQNSFNRAAREWGMNADRLNRNYGMLSSLNQNGYGAARDLANMRGNLASQRLDAIYGNSNNQRQAIGDITNANVNKFNNMSEIGSSIMGAGMQYGMANMGGSTSGNNGNNSTTASSSQSGSGGGSGGGS